MIFHEYFNKFSKEITWNRIQYSICIMVSKSFIKSIKSLTHHFRSLSEYSYKEKYHISNEYSKYLRYSIFDIQLRFDQELTTNLINYYNQSLSIVGHWVHKSARIFKIYCNILCSDSRYRLIYITMFT